MFSDIWPRTHHKEGSMKLYAHNILREFWLDFCQTFYNFNQNCLIYASFFTYLFQISTDGSSLYIVQCHHIGRK